MTSPVPAVDVDEGPRALLAPRELLAIFTFWALLAGIAVTGRLIDPRVEVQPNVARALVTLSIAEYALWALLTVPIVWLASRLSIEGERRLGRVVLLVAVGIVLAVGVDLALAWLREELVPVPPRRARRLAGLARRRPRGPGPFAGLGFLDDLMVYFAVLGGGIARDYYLRYRSREAESARLTAHAAQLQAQLAEARLAVLRTQLDPHFLFNTLNAVSALVERDPKGVRRMIARLAELLRHTLEGPPRQEVALDEELELLRRYLDIMQVRFQGRLEVRQEIDPAVRAAFVPSFVLQPLVENALKHGVGAREGAALVEVRAWRDGDELVLRVRDDGTGPPEDAAPGVGTRNTVSRLEQLYGARHRFTLARADGGGAIAEVRFPYHTEPMKTTDAG